MHQFLVLHSLSVRHVIRGSIGRSPPRIFFALSGKMCWTLFKTIRNSSKNLGPSQKTLCPSWRHKLVGPAILTL